MVKDITVILLVVSMIVGAIAVLVAGPVLLFAWMADILYSNIFEADGKTQIDYWYFVLGVLIARFLLPMPTISRGE